MRGDTYTINGLLAYKLLTAQSNIAQNVKKSINLLKNAFWGIRVWRRNQTGTEFEITAGTPVAVVSRGVAGQGLQSNTWNCPATNMSTTDAIVVRVYHMWSAGSWVKLADFITEQLGAGLLNATQWTVFYYTKLAFVGFPIPRATDAWFYWGTAVYNSRITNFTWTVGGDWHDVCTWYGIFYIPSWKDICIWYGIFRTPTWNDVCKWFGQIPVRWYPVTALLVLAFFMIIVFLDGKGK